MWMLVSAVATASLIGSTHCVGMCGPLALWAVGTMDTSRSRVILNTTLYHVGRLVTYALMGCLAGVIGELVDLGGNSIGLRMTAARLFGTAMILVGLWRLSKIVLPALVNRTSVNPPKPSWIGKQLVRLRPWISRMPAFSRALAVGLLTALLPCGWLYVFAFVAAGTADALNGTIVMFAFWIGTLPLLIGLVASASLLKRRFQSAIPAVASIMLIVTGYCTASNRAFASVGSFRSLEMIASDDLSSLPNKAMPCCCRLNEDQ